MNRRIAALLKDRISEYTYVDRLAGMVRTVKYERNGSVVIIPVATDSEADLACDDSQVQDMVPDERYGCMVYFEDRGVTRTQSRTRGVSFVCRLRLVCWVNAQKFGNDPEAASKILSQFVGTMEHGPYNSGPFVGARHRVEGIPQSGHGIFSAYTYPESARQYLMPPFDAFAIDIATEVRIKPGCQDEVESDDEACWTPSTTKRRRNPSEFTCEELTDPATGLQQEQRNECLLPTYDFDDLDVRANVTSPQQVQLIAWLCDSGGGPCAAFVITINGEAYLVVEEPCGGAEDIEVVNTGDRTVGSLSGGKWVIPATVVQLKTELGANIGSAQNLQSGESHDITAPDGTATIRDSANTPLAGPYDVTPGQNRNITVADALVNRDGVFYGFVKAQGVINVPSNCPACDPVNIRNTADDSTLATVASGADWPLPQVLVYWEQADGSIVEQVYDVTGLIGGGSQQQINLQVNRVAVRRTDGTSTLFYVTQGDPVDLPALRLAYTDAAGSPATASEPITALVSGEQSTGNTIPRFRVFKSNGSTLHKTGSIVAPDVTLNGVEISNSAATVLATVEDGDTPTIADSTITKPDGTTVGLPATVALDVRDYRSGIAYNFGYIMASGQTTVHRTGDEGTMRSDGFFNYTRPVYPVSFAELSGFSTLAANNVHGNTLRFTNRAGSAAATSGNRVIQDHLTGIEWYVPSSLPALGTWNTAIDAAAASSVESSTDWYLPTDKMLDSITDDSLTSSLNYGPWLITTPLWTATTRPDDSTIARVFRPDIGSLFGNLTKTNAATCSYIFCRRFI